MGCAKILREVAFTSQLRLKHPRFYRTTAVILEQIDQLLADWRKKVDFVGHNLMDLYGLPTYQRLSGTSGFPKAQLTGITEARVTPALEAMNAPLSTLRPTCEYC